MAKKTSNIEDVEVEDTKQDYSSLVEGYNPFGEGVIERDYTKTKQSLTSEQRGPIEEPTFEPPPIGSGYEDDLEGGEDPSTNVFDERVSDLDSDDKKFAHENLVDTVLGGYDMLHTFGKRWASITEEKLIEKEKKGEIDLRMQIMVSPVQALPLFEFVENYNKQVEDTLTVDEEFVEKVRPIMVRIAEKRGLGMTDEQNLMVLFGKDILEKGMQVIGFKKSLTNILDLTYQNFKQQQSHNFNSPPPPQEGPPPQTQPMEEPMNTPPPPTNTPPINEEEIEDFEEYEDEENEREEIDIRGVSRGELIEISPPELDIKEDTQEDNNPKLIEPNANDIQESEEK